MAQEDGGAVSLLDKCVARAENAMLAFALGGVAARLTTKIKRLPACYMPHLPNLSSKRDHQCQHVSQQGFDVRHTQPCSSGRVQPLCSHEVDLLVSFFGKHEGYRTVTPTRILYIL